MHSSRQQECGFFHLCPSQALIDSGQKHSPPMYMAQLDTVSQNNTTLYERMEIKQRFVKSLLMTASTTGQENETGCC